MIDGLPVMGLFVLACTLQDVDPRTGAHIAETYPASLVARDGSGAFTGWYEVDGQERALIRRLPNGTVRMSGFRLQRSGEKAWAELTPIAHTDRFKMEWFLHQDHPIDGKPTAAIWSKGECEQLAKPKTEGAVR